MYYSALFRYEFHFTSLHFDGSFGGSSALKVKSLFSPDHSQLSVTPWKVIHPPGLDAVRRLKKHTCQGPPLDHLSRARWSRALFKTMVYVWISQRCIGTWMWEWRFEISGNRRFYAKKCMKRKESGVLWHFQFQEFLKFQELSYPCSKQGHGVCCLDHAFRTIKNKVKCFEARVLYPAACPSVDCHAKWFYSKWFHSSFFN